MGDTAPDEISEEATLQVEAILGDVQEQRKRRYYNARMAGMLADAIQKLAGADAYKCDGDELSRTLTAAHRALRRVLRCCGGGGRMSAPFRVERHNDAVVVRLEPTGAGWEQRFLLRSDAHWDNPHCNSDLELKHLKQAVEYGAGILDFGDLFDAMQGKHDKRSNKGALRSDVGTSAYLDTLIEKAVERYKPFAKHWILMAEGNHETKVRDHCETDLTQRLVAALNVTTGSHIQAGKYKGWVRFAFQRDQEQHSRRLWYIHGYGGGGPVTLDMIQRQRQLVYVDGADIMVSGHTHDQWYQITEKEGLDQRDALYRRSVHYLKLGCYKDDYAAGGGWHVETGKPPKPLGAWWLVLGWSRARGPTMRFERAD